MLVEAGSHDAQTTARFPRQVFGWEITYDEKTGIYETPAEAGQSAFGGGVFTLRRARLPFLTIYIQVDDIEAKLEAVKAHGGLIVDPPLTLPSGSRICLFNEPSGATLAMIQPARQTSSQG